MQLKGLGAVALVSTIGALWLGAGATAHAHPRGNSYPESKGWHLVDDRSIFKVGDVCSGKVILRYRGHERTLVKGPDGYRPLLPGEEFAPGPGDRFISEAGDDVRFSLYSPSTQKSVRRPASGDFHQTVSRNGKDLKIVGMGSNLYFDFGTTGLLWTDGIQRFEFKGFMGKSPSVQNFRIRDGDPQQQLCDKLGLDPVESTRSPSGG